MNKWIVSVLALLMAAGVQAGEKGKEKGPMTKEKYVAAQQKRAEASEKEFDKAKCEARFAKMDKNGDGVLTADEMPVRKGKKPNKAEKDDSTEESNDSDE